MEGGLYTVAEASKLLLVSPRRVRGWISGYKAKPVLQNDVGWLNGSLAFSFANLMEMRFIEFFAGCGVKVASIRAMAAEARNILDHPHPFATNTLFRTDGRAIFAEISAGIDDDAQLYDLRKKNWAMLPIIEQSLFKDTTYDPAGDASSWRPRVDSAPNVIIYPRRSFGQPVLKPSGVPTRTLNEAWAAEGDIASVAKWYEIPEAHVLEAITFERRLAMSA
jgi:uncharacterized protein (DUF433 family)